MGSPSEVMRVQPSVYELGEGHDSAPNRPHTVGPQVAGDSRTALARPALAAPLALPSLLQL